MVFIAKDMVLLFKTDCSGMGQNAIVYLRCSLDDNLIQREVVNGMRRKMKGFILVNVCGYDAFRCALDD